MCYENGYQNFTRKKKAIFCDSKKSSIQDFDREMEFKLIIYATILNQNFANYVDVSYSEKGVMYMSKICFPNQSIYSWNKGFFFGLHGAI